MKIKSLLALITMLILIMVAGAQNPKTNAGKVKKSPEGYTPPPLPTPPQKPSPATKKDTVVQKPVAPVDTQGQVTSSSYVAPSEPHYGNNVLFTLELVVGLTQGQFNQVSNGQWAMGFGINGMYNFMGTKDKEKSPVNIYMGLGFEYLYFGGSSKSHSYNDPPPYNAINNKITTSISSNVYSFMLMSRVEFFNGPVIPFVEGAVGFRVFDASESVTVSRTQESGSSLPSGITFTPTSTSDTHHLESSTTGTYGFGGGLRLSHGVIGFEAKMMYMKGSTARYIDPESVKYNASTDSYSYQTKTSRTDMLLPSLSVSLLF